MHHSTRILSAAAFVLLMLAGIITRDAAAAAPANDNFASATVVSGATFSTSGTTVGATRETGEPVHAGITGSASVWYSWVAPASVNVTMTTFGSGFDTIVGVYTGASVSTLTTITSNDDNLSFSLSGVSTSQVSFFATMGTTYFIAIDGKATATGTFTLALPAVPPPNDTFSAAKTLSPVFNATDTGYNIGAGTAEVGEPAQTIGSGGRSVWWNWTAPSSGNAVVLTTGSDFDTVTSVYTGAAVNALTLLIADDDGGVFGRDDKAAFVAVAGTTYRIAIRSFGGGLGSIALKVAPNAGPPAITNAQASSNLVIRGSTVTFNAAATDPDGDALTFMWNYGDGSAVETGASVAHVYATGGTYFAQLTITDGVNLTTQSFTITVMTPPTSIANIGNGKTVTNPMNGIAVSVARSEGGIIELNVDVSQLRETFDVSTTFEGRTTPVTGTRPGNQFTQSGVFAATSVAKSGATERGRARKTLAVSDRELGLSGALPAPDSTELTVAKLSGKFMFAQSKPDQVTLTADFVLPAGFDVARADGNKLSIGIGNVTDSVQVDAKGKGGESTRGFIKKVKVKYPRLPKDDPVTQGGEKAQITITLTGLAFSTAGFDTEGITGSVLPAEESLKAVPRNIQVALVLAGVSYEALAPVDFKLAKHKETGQINGRR